MRHFPNRILTCAYDIFEYCREKYPTREVHPDRHCPANEFNYFNLKSGEVRIVRRKIEIWKCDYDLGFPYVKRAR